MPKITAPIFGIVGTLRFVVSLDYGEEDEGFLYRYASERRGSLEREIKQQLAETLGSDYELLDVQLTDGSVHIALLLTAVGTFYVTISQYDDFINGLNKLTSQLKRLIERFFESAAPGAPGIDISVRGSWEPSPSVIDAHRSLMASSRFDASMLLVAYVVLSNAALLSLFFWLVIRHLK